MKKSLASVAAFSLLSLASAMTLTAGCSTAGGKQESVVNNASASSDVKGSVTDVNSRARNVFKEMGIGITASQAQNSGKEQELTGQAGDKTVILQMNEVGQGMTHVQVTAKEGALQWNEDYAQSILSKLIQES